MNKELLTLKPDVVWNFFAQICDIPRPSKHEQKIRNFLINFAKDLNLEYEVSKIGNVIIKKPSSKGMENCKTVILQAHMDMVAAKLATVKHDFLNDAIAPIIEDGWVKTRGTTLGADNGIGLAYSLAILAANDIAHPALEVLITTDEEAGMSGAFALAQNELSGEILLNLDSENDAEVCIGCAGGIDTKINLTLEFQELKNTEKIAYKLVLDGLYGGHSGVDIHLNRANAIKEMFLFLYSLQQSIQFDISHISGGKLRNVIATYCEVIILIDIKHSQYLEEIINNYAVALKKSYLPVEKNINLKFEKYSNLPTSIIESKFTKKIILAVVSCFNGLSRMNLDLQIPELSSNLGSIKLINNVLEIITMQRSPDNFIKQNLANMIAANFENIGATVTFSSNYPGWLPNTKSAILEIVKKCYNQLFNTTIKVSATHGGLECGLILDKYPMMDAVSIGATIIDPHSGYERVSIHSVNKVWYLLLEILKNIPVK